MIYSPVTYKLSLTHQNTHRGSPLSCPDRQTALLHFLLCYAIFGAEAKKAGYDGEATTGQWRARVPDVEIKIRP